MIKFNLEKNLKNDFKYIYNKNWKKIWSLMKVEKILLHILIRSYKL